jgi:hypothetical protein
VNTPSTLDRFESALLGELRAHVATRPATSAPAPEAPRPRHRRRWAAGLAAAAAAATAYVVVSPGGPAVSPAYAIDETADGDVVVTIHRLEDAEGLERALREHGIDAEVSFDPDEGITHEAPGFDGEAPPPVTKDLEDGTVEHEQESAGPELDFEDPAGCGTGEPATLAPVGDDWVLTIPADSPLQDRKVEITTGPGGLLTAAYAGDDPGSYCAVASLAAPVSE